MSPAVRDPQMLKGILPVLVIALLTERESYGYEPVTRLQDAGLEDLAAGTVYPVLTRLERDGLISSRLVASSSGPARKYYLPTDTGTAHLAQAAAGWRELASTVETVLGRIEPAAGTSASSTTPATDRPDRADRLTTDPTTEESP